MRARYKTGLMATLIGLTAVGTTQAAVISSTPNANFANGSYTFDLADGAASYTLSGSSNPFLPGDIATGGQGLVNAVAGAVAVYGTGDNAPFVGDNLAGSFESYPDGASLAYDGTASIALGLDLVDGFHYGYAQLDDDTLVSYGYESTPGVGIRAGATATPTPEPNPVPEPGSWAALGFGVVLLGLGLGRRRQALGDHLN